MKLLRKFSDNQIPRVSLIGLVMLGLALSGCGNDPTVSPEPTGDPVMDLTAGNTWQYHFRMNEPNAPVQDVVRAILGETEVTWAGETISVAVEQVTSGLDKAALPGTSRLLRNEPGGLYCYGSVDGSGSAQVHAPHLVAPGEAGPGEVFDVGSGITLVCVARDSLVTTDFGDVTADVFFYSLFEGTVVVPDVYLVSGVGLTRYYSAQATEVLVGYQYR